MQNSRWQQLSSGALAVACLLVVGPDRSPAGVIVGYNPSDPNSHLTYDRFASGYPTAPVANTSPQFIGNGYSNDLSGVGWKADNPVFSVAMVSPRHFIGAAHVGYANGSQLNFVDPAGTVHTYAVQQTRTLTTTFIDSNGQMQTKPSDVILGTLAFDPSQSLFTNSAYPIVQAPVTILPLVLVPDPNHLGQFIQTGQNSPPSFYSGRRMLNHGQNASYSTSPHLGTNNVDNISVESFGDYTQEATVGVEYGFNSTVNGEFYLIGGDSGGPSFMPYNGQLTLLGGHYGVSNPTTTPNDGDVSADSFLPYYIDQMQSAMALDTDASHVSGYSLNVIPVPEPGTFVLLSLTAVTLGGGRWLRGRRPARDAA